MSDYDEDYYDEVTQHRYLFTVRQQFGEEPRVDAFYELKVPAGVTGDQAKIMTKLDKRWCKEEIQKDTQALNGMQLRLRFNSDMFQHVCLVRTQHPITADDLDAIIQMKNTEGTLKEFLDESVV